MLLGKNSIFRIKKEWKEKGNLKKYLRSWKALYVFDQPIKSMNAVYEYYFILTVKDLNA